jgi:hypothetical protein
MDYKTSALQRHWWDILPLKTAKKLFSGCSLGHDRRVLPLGDG